MWRDEKGGRWLVTTDSSGRDTFQELSVLVLSVRDASLNLKFGSAGLPMRLDAFVFARPRAVGCRVYIGLSSLYKVFTSIPPLVILRILSLQFYWDDGSVGQRLDG